MTQDVDRDRVQLKEGIIEVALSGAQNAQAVINMADEITKLSNNKRRDILVDASALHGFGDGTGLPKAIELLKNFPFRRFAVFGATPKFANLRVKALTDGVGEPDRVKFFRKEEDARKWFDSKI